MRTRRQDGVRVLLVVCAVAAWPDLAIARHPEAGLPANLYVDLQVRVRVLPEDQPRPTAGVDARNELRFDGGGTLVSAHVYLRMTPQVPRVIAHEMEHIIEQLDGIDLRAQAGNGVVWKSRDTSFETRRAIEAGLLVAQQVARVAGRGEPQVEAAAGAAPLAIVQREREEAPFSARTGRVSANGRFVALISAARLVERDRNDLRDVYVFDRETGRLSLESVGRLGESADGDTQAVDISAESGCSPTLSTNYISPTQPRPQAL